MSKLGERYRELFADVDAEKKAAVAAERERCAKIAEGFANYGGGIANSIAAAIRNKE